MWWWMWCRNGREELVANGVLEWIEEQAQVPGQYTESDGRIWGAEPRAAIFLPLFFGRKGVRRG
jgi:hypothetical protein